MLDVHDGCSCRGAAMCRHMAGGFAYGLPGAVKSRNHEVTIFVTLCHSPQFEPSRGLKPRCQYVVAFRQIGRIANLITIPIKRIIFSIDGINVKNCERRALAANRGIDHDGALRHYVDAMTVVARRCRKPSCFCRVFIERHSRFVDEYRAPDAFFWVAHILEKRTHFPESHRRVESWIDQRIKYDGRYSGSPIF